MEELLNRLIDKSPDRALEAQLVVAGAIYTGAVRKSGYDGIFEMLVHGQHKNGATMMIKMFVRADRIDTIMLPGEEPRVKPAGNGGLVLGGR